MKYLQIAGFIILFAIQAVSQQAVTVLGKITTGLTSSPVIATIVIRQNGQEIRRTTSNEAGEYRFDGIPPGDYEVEAEYHERPSRTSKVAQKVHVAGNTPATVNLDFGIFMSQLMNLPIHETVTVSAGASQTVEQVSKTVDVIDGQQMRDRADFSLAETLRIIPGFRVSQLGGFGRTATIKTRGLRNQDTAILIDGIRFRDASAITGDASPFLSDFTLTSVSKIEVLRGSGSSLYGTNAIGGTVDFQTPTAKSGTHGQIGGAFGGYGLGRFRGNISHGTSNGKFGVNAGVSRTVYTKGIDGDDRAENTNFQSRVEFNPTAKTNISGRFFFSNAFVRLNSSPDTFGTLPASNATIINANPGVNFVPDADDPDNIQQSRFLSGQFAVIQIINSKLVVSGYYQGLATRRRNDDGPLGPGFQSPSTSIFDGTIQTVNAHVNWTALPQNELTAGYEYEHERFGNIGTTPTGAGNFFTHATQSSNTFYVQELLRLLDGRLQLAGGFRAQRFGLGRPEFSLANAPYNNLTLTNPPTAVTFDGAMSYFFAKTGTKLRAHVGNGYRVPSLFERFGTFFSTFGPPSFVALGDPFLKPEKTIAFDAGIEQNVAKDCVRLSATYFYTRLNDIIGFGNVVPPIGLTTRPFGGYQNQKGGTASGGEFSVKTKATATTDIFASYTFTDSVQLTQQVSGSGILNTLGVPDHQFTLVATQQIKRAWVNFDFLATSTYLAPIFSNSTFNTYIYRFKGNRKGDLTVGYTFAFKKEKMTLRVYGTIENVFDQEYYENGFKTFRRTARVGTTFGF